MSDVDYTDGGGWAKLDQTSADELTRIIGSFGGRSLVQRTHILLTMFSMIGRDGTISVGYDTIAKAAGVEVTAVRRLVSSLMEQDEDGEALMYDVGTDKKPRRIFAWMLDAVSGVARNRHPGWRKPSIKRHPGVAENQPKRHPTDTEYQIGVDALHHPSPAAPPDGGRGGTERVYPPGVARPPGIGG